MGLALAAQPLAAYFAVANTIMVGTFKLHHGEGKM